MNNQPRSLHAQAVAALRAELRAARDIEPDELARAVLGVVRQAIRDLPNEKGAFTPDGGYPRLVRYTEMGRVLALFPDESPAHAPPQPVSKGGV